LLFPETQTWRRTTCSGRCAINMMFAVDGDGAMQLAFDRA